MGKTIYITDKDAMEVDRVVVNRTNLTGCKILYSCDLIDYYNARLKADMVDMLTEIQEEIEEMDSGCGWDGYRKTNEVIGIIQEKIDKLKEQENDNQGTVR